MDEQVSSFLPGALARLKLSVALDTGGSMNVPPRSLLAGNRRCLFHAARVRLLRVADERELIDSSVVVNYLSNSATGGSAPMHSFRSHSVI